MNEQHFSTLLREEWDRIPVGPPPVAAVVGRASHQGRRRTVRVGAALAAAAAVVVAVVVVATRPAPQDPRPIGPVVDNPVDVAWTDGRSVHLAHTALDLGDDLDDWTGGLSRVAEDGGTHGVVYVDGNAVVHHVDSQGRTRTIGRTAPELPLVVGSPTSSWAAWIAADGERRELVVHDTATDEEVVREPLSSDLEVPDESVPLPAVVAVDGERVWLRTAVGDRFWEPGEVLRPTPYAGSLVLDAAGGTVITTPTEAGDVPTVTFGPDGDAQHTVRGGAGRVSPDGRHVLVEWLPTSGENTWRLYDAVTGAQLPLDLPDLSDRIAQEAALSNEHAVLAIRKIPTADHQQADHPVTLVSCGIADGRCVKLPTMTAEDGSEVMLDLEG